MASKDLSEKIRLIGYYRGQGATFPSEPKIVGVPFVTVTFESRREAVEYTKKTLKGGRQAATNGREARIWITKDELERIFKGMKRWAITDGKGNVYVMSARTSAGAAARFTRRYAGLQIASIVEATEF